MSDFWDELLNTDVTAASSTADWFGGDDVTSPLSAAYDIQGGGAPTPNWDMSLADQYAQYGEGRQLADSASALQGLEGSSAGGSSGALSSLFKTLTGPEAQQLLRLFLAGSTAYGALNRYKEGPQGHKTPAELAGMIPGGMASGRGWAPGTFANPGQTRAFQFATPQKAGEQLERTYASAMRNPIVPGKRYAEGGDVMMEELMGMEPQMEEPQGALAAVLGAPGEPFAGYVQGVEGGQSDGVQAWLSPGEYVWDADVVSALGDGNNEAGAQMLDEARERIRAEKRSADPSQIPPPAQDLSAYMEGAI